MAETDCPWCELGFTWANGVLEGRVQVGRFARRAVERWARDMRRRNRKTFEYDFDPIKAEEWLRFLAGLPHVKGRWARDRELFSPSGYQCFIVMNLYGWVHKSTWMRRFREAYVEIPRKNGKSFLAAGIGLGHLCIDNETGAEVYSGATSEKQAWEVFRPARQMMLRAPELAGAYGVEVNAKSLWILEEASHFDPLIGKPGDGASPSCAIIDEFHEHKTSDLIDTMETGMGARDQPMMFVITTAGSDFGGPCRDRRGDCVRILEGTVTDETVFAIIFTIDETDSWDSVEALEKANPNIGVSVSRDYLIGQMEKAKRSPVKQAAYKTKHLNMWVGAKSPWMNMLKLQRCEKRIVLDESYLGRLCYPALDLASKIDLAAIAMLFPGPDDLIDAFFRFYLPEETVYAGVNDRYVAWAEATESGVPGYDLIVTPGDTIDYGRIQADTEEICGLYNVPCVAFDPWQAVQLSQQLGEQGIPMIELRPTVFNFSESMKELEARIYRRKWRYYNQIFTWMVGNVVAKRDKKDNIYPDKERPENKIDGVVAAIMAMNRVLSEDGPSVYESRGLLG